MIVPRPSHVQISVRGRLSSGRQSIDALDKRSDNDLRWRISKVGVLLHRSGHYVCSVCSVSRWPCPLSLLYHHQRGVQLAKGHLTGDSDKIFVVTSIKTDMCYH